MLASSAASLDGAPHDVGFADTVMDRTGASASCCSASLLALPFDSTPSIMAPMTPGGPIVAGIAAGVGRASDGGLSPGGLSLDGP